MVDYSRMPTKALSHGPYAIQLLHQKGHYHRCSDKKNCPLCYKEKRSPAVERIETSQVFSSGIEAAKSLGKHNASDIYRCCRNEIKTAFGFHWKYPTEGGG